LNHRPEKRQLGARSGTWWRCAFKISSAAPIRAAISSGGSWGRGLSP